MYIFQGKKFLFAMHTLVIGIPKLSFIFIFLSLVLFLPRSDLSLRWFYHTGSKTDEAGGNLQEYHAIETPLLLMLLFLVVGYFAFRWSVRCRRNPAALPMPFMDARYNAAEQALQRIPTVFP